MCCLVGIFCNKKNRRVTRKFISSGDIRNHSRLCAIHKPRVEKCCRGRVDDFDLALRGASWNGHLKLAELAISKGATDFNTGLCIACFNGHLEFAKFMILQGATHFNRGLARACDGRQFELAKLMILKGATQCAYCDKSSFEHLLN